MGVASSDYQVGAHLEALVEDVLENLLDVVANHKIHWTFFHISTFQKGQ